MLELVLTRGVSNLIAKCYQKVNKINKTNIHL